MIMPPSPFKTVLSVALVALALAIVAFGVMPAQAQQGPGLNFSLQLPEGSVLGGPADSKSSAGNQGDSNNDNAPQRCLTDREVRRGVEANGYDGVEIAQQLPNDRVEVRGQNGNWLYSMRVDRCTGQTERVQRVRRVQGGGFGLQFNFSN